VDTAEELHKRNYIGLPVVIWPHHAGTKTTNASDLGTKICA
jgi:hypothetical protein